jgi:hypothetical protein
MVNPFERQSKGDVLERVRISEVWAALGGPKLRRMRGPAFWRDGDGLNVSLDDSRGVWHDFVTDQGGGVLDLVIQARGGNRADALRWCAELAGIPLDDKPLSADDRARWAAERRELERDLPGARCWRRAAVSIVEEVLGGLKGALLDPTLPQPRIGEIGDVESMLQRFRKVDGAALVAEYAWWREHYPGLAAGMVRAAKAREQAERFAVMEYLRRSHLKRGA